jgi:hypothetical protein
MIAPKILPVRPSLESLRKQAKKLARETAAGKSPAVARARAQLPGTELPLSQRDAFICASRFQHQAIASILLERCVALDKDLGQRIDGRPGRDAFLGYLCAHRLDITAVASGRPWQAFVMEQALRAFGDDDLPRFTRMLESEPWLLGDACVSAQVDTLEGAAFRNQEPFIVRLLDLDPAVLHCPTPPQSSALVFAFEYGNAHLVPLLTHIWPLPDDLPRAAGIGDFARVKCWFDAAGRAALGDPNDHYPGNDPRARANLYGGRPLSNRFSTSRSPGPA